MKVRTCFIHVPDNYRNGTPIFPFKPGRYTMYYYGPKTGNPGEIIVESLEGMLTTVPKEWVRLI